jgi:hypothetical protein
LIPEVKYLYLKNVKNGKLLQQNEENLLKNLKRLKILGMEGKEVEEFVRKLLT